MDLTDHQAHRVVVIGAGFGGLQAVKGLKDSGAEITLVDQRNHHLFQPLLYQAATSVLSNTEIAWPIRSMMAKRSDVTTLLGRVCGVDLEAKTVALEDGDHLPFDTLVIATGARHSYFGNDHWEDAAPGLKTLEDATHIRRKILMAFEAAERCEDPAERQALLTFGVIGAGPTGVELAGIIAELAQRTIPREFRNINTRDARVMLIEAGPRVLAQFPEDLSAYTARALEERGVEVMLGRPVRDCTTQGLTIGDEFIPCRTTLWAAGVAASPAAQWLGVQGDRAGRVSVNENLSLAGHPDVFVIGDTASVMTAEGKPVPGVAPAAKQQGAFVAKLVKARLRGAKLPERFSYRHLGNLATIGRGAAVVHYGKLKLTGRLAWWFWGISHVYFLIGNRSRAAVAWSWIWTYLRGENSARLITEPAAPQAMADPKAVEG